jgi:predicted RNase H-like HicB family nuclease
MRFTIEAEQEEDGRWLAEVLELPGALAYGQTPEEAIAKVQALALRVLADRLEHKD